MSYVDQNGHLPISPKTSNKIPCFETRFLENQVSNRDIWLNSFKTWAFCYLFWAKGANAYFSRHMLVNHFKKIKKKKI